MSVPSAALLPSLIEQQIIHGTTVSLIVVCLQVSSILSLLIKVRFELKCTQAEEPECLLCEMKLSETTGMRQREAE